MPLQEDLLKIADSLTASSNQMRSYVGHFQVIQNGINLLLNEEIKNSLLSSAENEDGKTFIHAVIQQAKEEKENEYQKSITQGLVTIYSILEAGVSDVCRIIFPQVSEVAEFPGFKKANISYKRLIESSTEEVYDYFYEEYERTIAQNHSYGYERFDALMKPLGINTSGILSKSDKDNIFELAQIRNLIVHRTGKIDKRFSQLFPKGKFKEGNNIRVAKEDFAKYAESCIALMVAIIKALPDKYLTNNAEG